jgi:hypothetical protein
MAPPDPEARVRAWLRRYYKPQRANREPDTFERLVRDRVGDLELHGEALISRHDSVTGEAERIFAEGRGG